MYAKRHVGIPFILLAGLAVFTFAPARDAADALAAAICHANAGRIGALTQGARLPAKRAALRVRRSP